MRARLATRLFLALCLAVAGATTAGQRQPTAIEAAAARIAEDAAKHRMVLLGEFHGTRETPLLVEALVAALPADAPLVVGLEIPQDEQASLDAYMASDGGAAAKQALRSRAFWTRGDDQHDGRRSEDMLDLIEAMRALAASGRPVSLMAYDTGFLGDAAARDAAMAAALRARFEADPLVRLLVLTGNVHAMLERPGYAPHIQAPMGSHLRDLDPASIRITARTGASWGCLDEGCGPIKADGARMPDGPTAGVYTRMVVLPEFTPARLIGAKTGR